MVETIGSMVHGDRSRGRSARFLHLGGSLLGGATTGFAAAVAAVALRAALDGETRSATVWVLAGLVLVALAFDAAREGRKLGLARQTPRAWRYLLPPKVTAFLYGFDLGLGWSTRIYFVSFVVAVAAAAFTFDPAAGALIGGAFGLGRGGFVALVVSREGDAGSSSSSLIGRAGVVRVANSLALLQLGAVAVAAGLTTLPG